MPEISAVIITFNEESNIERCIKSVLKVSDEVVVVDSFSTDSTVEISRSLGAKVYQHEFAGYLEQKNYAVSKATYRYILSLDADEALSCELEESILQVKETLKFDGYYFNRLNHYVGTWIKHSNWYPDRKLRLFDSTKGEWKGINPHDRYMLQEGSKTKHLKGDMYHWVLDSYEAHIEKVNNFSTIAAREYFKLGRSTNGFSMTCHIVWRFIKAYIFKGGFRDGFNGFAISSLSAYTSLLKYLKLMELNRESNTENRNKKDNRNINIAGHQR